MKKRILSLLIIMAMWPTCFNCSAKEIEKKPIDDLLKIYKTFEEDNDEENFTLVSGGYEITNDGNGSQGVFVFNKGRTAATGTLDLKKVIGKGVLEVSFDYKVTGWRNRFYIRMFAGTTGDVNETFNDYGSFGYFDKGIGWSVADHRAPYTTNRWYRVNMYINMDTRMIYYYIDGKLYGYTTVKEGFPDIRKFEFIYHGSYERTMIDNLCAIEYRGSDPALPEEVRWSTFTDTTTKNPGRIFFDKDKVDLIVTAGNKTDRSGDFELKCKVLNSGRIVNETTQEIHLDEGEVKEIEYEGKTDGYGYYTFIPSLYDKSGNLLTNGREYKFSVANVPPEDLKDKTMGVQMQTNVEINRNDVENIDLPLMSRLGFSYVRGGAPDFASLTTDGILDVNSWLEYTIEKKFENNLEIIPIMMGTNKNFTKENPPRSDYAIEKFAESAAMCCQWMEKKQGYPLRNLDVWNEYWMGGSGFNPDNGTPEDYANLLKAVYTAVKKVSPTTTVWGLSGVNSSHLEWTERILKAGGGDYMDGYTLHPYNNKGTPDKADFPGLKQKYDELFAKYGYTDKLCWVSEWGWPSCNVDGYTDERHQAAYFVEANIINTGNGLFDMTNWYSSNNVENDNGQESRFGLLRGAFDTVGYEAKPSYLAAANYMNMMIDAKHVENYDISDNITLYRYKLRDGRDALIGWAKEYSEAAAPKIDTSNVSVYDMFGNFQNLSSINKEFSFMFTDVPIYITGHFTDVQKSENIMIKTEKTEINMVKGDKSDISITKNFDEDAQVVLDLPGGVKIIENSGFVNNKCRIILESEIIDREEDTIPVNVVTGGKTVFSCALHVAYISPIDFSLSTRPYSSKQVDRWQAIIKIKGNFFDQRVEGKLHITAPAELATGENPIKIPKVGPGGERIIKVNIPKSISKEAFTLKAILDMEGYESMELTETVNLRCSTFMKNKPVIDGKIDKGEWDVRTVMLMNNPKTFVKLSNIAYGGLDDLSAKVYTGWDYENFYLAVEVTDDVWAWDESLLWASDGVQFAMAPSKVGTQMAQIDIGTINDEKQVLMELSTNMANVGPVEDAEFDMSREGNVTTYELKIMWKDIFPDGFNLRKNSSVPFSMLINDNDGDGRRGFMENGGGIGVFKNVYEFLDLFLLF